MRTRLGWISIVLLVIAAVLTWGPFKQEGSSLHGAFVRIGLITAAIWLAWDDLVKLNPWTVGGVIVSIILVGRWGTRFIWVIPFIFLALYFLRPRQTKAQ
jgi:hypothetical protein